VLADINGTSGIRTHVSPSEQGRPDLHSIEKFGDAPVAH
jgi:hypothetical protein